MRKFVRPADAGASIPSPAHGRDLPQDGMEVDWSAYWARLEMRGDIVVGEAPAEPGKVILVSGSSLGKTESSTPVIELPDAAQPSDKSAPKGK